MWPFKKHHEDGHSACWHYIGISHRPAPMGHGDRVKVEGEMSSQERCCHCGQDKWGDIW